MIQKAERSNEVVVCFVREVHIGHTAKSVLAQSVLGGNIRKPCATANLLHVLISSLN